MIAKGKGNCSDGVVSREGRGKRVCDESAVIAKPQTTARRWLDVCVGALLLTGLGAMNAGASGQVVNDGAWVVSERPIGVYRGVQDAAFGTIVDVAFGANGRVAIADQDLGTVSVFSEEGKFLTSFGRRGEGPGEFELIAGLVSGPGGHLFVLDELRQRISEWTTDGLLVGDKGITLEGGARPIGEMGRFGAEGWYVVEASRMLPAAVDEVAEDTVRVFRLYDRVVRDMLAEVRGMLNTHFVIGGMPGMRRALFSPMPVGVPLGDCLLVGTTDVPRFRLVDEGGVEMGELRFDVKVEATGKRHRSEWVDAVMAEIKESQEYAGEDERRSIGILGERLQMASRVPFAEDIIVDSLGFLWVQSYSLPEGPGSSEWRVFTEEGQAQGVVFMPEDHRVVAIGESEIFAVGTDELGRQEVRVYGLDRRGDDTPRSPPPGCRASGFRDG